jgi:hypothetical protein
VGIGGEEWRGGPPTTCRTLPLRTGLARMGAPSLSTHALVRQRMQRRIAGHEHMGTQATQAEVLAPHIQVHTSRDWRPVPRLGSADGAVPTGVSSSVPPRGRIGLGNASFQLPEALWAMWKHLACGASACAASDTCRTQLRAVRGCRAGLLSGAQSQMTRGWVASTCL